MSRTYKATGINLKGQAFGEYDRLVTILTREFGLIRAIAPGARKHNSSLGGRSAMFVVNELLIANGRSLDKITQAQTTKTYPGLAKDLGKLAASQYIAEISLFQALSEQPQEELFELLNEHLKRLEELPTKEMSAVLACLCHAVFHLLALAGLTPQIQFCCLTQRPLIPNFNDPDFKVGFSINAGGTINLTEWAKLRKNWERQKMAEMGIIGGQKTTLDLSPQSSSSAFNSPRVVKEEPSKYEKDYETDYETIVHREELPIITSRLNANELAMFQQLLQPDVMQIDGITDYGWLTVEQILRQYTQYHFGHSIRSAALIDSYFSANL
jgi:DNA repair protein RecO (recombination protein O)